MGDKKEPEEDDTSLLRVFRQKKLILLCLVGGALLSYLSLSLLGPIYPGEVSRFVLEEQILNESIACKFITKIVPQIFAQWNEIFHATLLVMLDNVLVIEKHIFP